MFIEIITPSKKIYTGEISLVKLPGAKGSFEILENHAPIISTLEKGTIKVVDKDKQIHFFDVDGGVVETKSNKIIVLAESA
ncbi:ATP synthase F1 subunit epsilon [Sunxiuqinia elliptica]|uniref:ATP synthase F1 subcomplex epsilon subunit n=1 Tax=Sunxiuqinia elliptica TaxID=655355 RepID=A0A1I2CXL4_9BACT|nr:ATP synthase F1 subunit epsilon [Sunxiuqinia elliptica]TDO04015.1 ATP synthase F1 subcomplex epsilon subunit [Sunxiuqinia elliptica]TDO62297.1 ATP synthase F1 subcomplex epsilon subunit [Sunxiuqinia elliptica]SFE72470.1 F-type H+-transporting ATPase subunit epsilon [Sunxiuqinia elliptica]